MDCVDDEVKVFSPILALGELTISRSNDRSDAIVSSAVEDTSSNSIPFVPASDNASTATYPLSATEYPSHHIHLPMLSLVRFVSIFSMLVRLSTYVVAIFGQLGIWHFSSTELVFFTL